MLLTACELGFAVLLTALLLRWAVLEDDVLSCATQAARLVANINGASFRMIFPPEISKFAKVRRESTKE